MTVYNSLKIVMDSSGSQKVSSLLTRSRRLFKRRLLYLKHGSFIVMAIIVMVIIRLSAFISSTNFIAEILGANNIKAGNTGS